MKPKGSELPSPLPLPARPEIGLPHPLGATCDGSGTNFAVYAGNAEEVDLCLFDTGGSTRRAVMR
jgi:pullulanase/glycogen debranching enzyme